MKTMREDVVEMNYHVSIKEIPERYVASVRKVIPSYNCRRRFMDHVNARNSYKKY